MPLLRILTWAIILGATVLAGPNLPAQVLIATRQAAGALSRCWFVRSDATRS